MTQIDVLLDYVKDGQFFRVLPLNYSAVVHCQKSDGQFLSTVALFLTVTAFEDF